MVRKPCSSGIVSLLVLITTLACDLTGALPSPDAPWRCYSETGGFVQTFAQENSRVPLPCKYRLADFTCGDYNVKVTPGNALDAEVRFSPVTVRVKVVNTVTMETGWFRSSVGLLQKAEAGEVSKPWKITGGQRGQVDMAGYNDGVSYVAYMEVLGVFSVTFSGRFVDVKCRLPQLSSKGAPETLCGNGLEINEFMEASRAFHGGRFMVPQYVQYIVLNDTTVTQSKRCQAVASDFQGCERRFEAHAACNKFFNNPKLVSCLVDLGTPPQDGYDYCLRKVCHGDESNRPDLGNCTVVD